jgi:hypothetical protein
MKETGQRIGRVQDATNSSGFTGLPEGIVTAMGLNSIGSNGNWWSSTRTILNAWYRTRFLRYACKHRPNYKTFGFQCVASGINTFVPLTL